MPQSNVVGRGSGRVLCYTWSFKDPGSFHVVALPSFRVSESSTRSPNLTSSQGMRETASVGELRGQFSWARPENSVYHCRPHSIGRPQFMATPSHREAGKHGPAMWPEERQMVWWKTTQSLPQKPNWNHPLSVTIRRERVFYCGLENAWFKINCY